jgi:hypothetical protein
MAVVVVVVVLSEGRIREVVVDAVAAVEDRDDPPVVSVFVVGGLVV